PRQGPNRDEPSRPGLQPQANDYDLRGGTADGGDQGLIASPNPHPPVSVSGVSALEPGKHNASTDTSLTRFPTASPHWRHSPTVSDKEYFPYEWQCGRREPRRRHARACTRKVCWPLCAWTIRATIRGAGPYGLRCLHRDPRRNADGVCQMLYRHGGSVTL